MGMTLNYEPYVDKYKTNMGVYIAMEGFMTQAGRRVDYQ